MILKASKAAEFWKLLTAGQSRQQVNLYSLKFEALDGSAKIELLGVNFEITEKKDYLLVKFMEHRAAGPKSVQRYEYRLPLWGITDYHLEIYGSTAQLLITTGFDENEQDVVEEVVDIEDAPVLELLSGIEIEA